MEKIKCNLFEKIMLCSLLPCYGGIIVLFLTIITIIGKEYKNLFYCFLAFTILLISFLLSLAITLIIENKNNNRIELYNDYLIVRRKGKNKKFLYSEVQVVYCVCKWYIIPFAFMYKNGNGGRLEIKAISGQRIQCRILYYDYKKLKKKINNIIILKA